MPMNVCHSFVAKNLYICLPSSYPKSNKDSNIFLKPKNVCSFNVIRPLQTQTLYSSQGTPCEPIPTGKNLFSLQGTPVLITGSLFSLQGFPCKPLYFPVRDCSAICQIVSWFLKPLDLYHQLKLFYILQFAKQNYKVVI